MKTTKIILTCEHAVDTVPSKFQKYFKGKEDLLKIHRAIDFGAAEIAEQLKVALKSPLFKASCTRLLVDCNRSLNNVQCFSEVTENMTKEDKQDLIDVYYLPYRQEVVKNIEEAIKSGAKVLHLSIHSFTPVFKGVKREGDICLLYDPKRPSEKVFVHAWQKLLQEKSKYRIRRNYPYVGYSDGFTTYLRKVFPQNYSGIEVEVNQAITRQADTLKEVYGVLTKVFPVL